MKTISIFIVFVFCCQLCMSQKRTTDSLLMVRDFLKEVEAAIPVNRKQADLSFIRLQKLIRRGTAQREVLQRQFDANFSNDTSGKKEILQQFNLVMQSAILLKTDLKQAGFDSETAREEMKFLRQRLPALMQSIQYYHKKAGATGMK